MFRAFSLLATFFLFALTSVDAFCAGGEAYNLRQENARGELILVHGMFDTTNSMRSFGDHFYRLGYNVTAPLLPGHQAGYPGFENNNFEVYVEFIRAQIRERYQASGGRPVDLSGFCFGSTVAAVAADLEKEKVGKIILFSPPFETALKLSSFSFKDFGRYVKLLKRLFPESNDVSISRAFGIKATAYQVMDEASAKMAQALVRPPFQYFAIATEVDKIVNNTATIDFFERAGQAQNILLLKTPSAPRHEDLPRAISRFDGSELPSFKVFTSWLDQKLISPVPVSNCKSLTERVLVEEAG